jgi:hypothetical protein
MAPRTAEIMIGSSWTVIEEDGISTSAAKDRAIGKEKGQNKSAPIKNILRDRSDMGAILLKKVVPGTTFFMRELSDEKKVVPGTTF